MTFFRYKLLVLTASAVTYCTSSGTDCYDYSRDQWKAKSPAGRTPMATPVTHIFIHHTDMGTCSDLKSCSTNLQSIQDFHQIQRGWEDIGYNFLIGGDGKVYEGRGWHAVGAHTLNHNSNAIGIAFLGNYQSVDPPTSMLNAAKNLISCGVKKNLIKNAYTLQGHRDVMETICPGDKLENIIKTWPRFIGKTA